MKIAVCGDVHIGASKSLGRPKPDGSNERNDDYENTLNYCIDYCIDNKVDVFIQTGDLFEKRNPTPLELNIADRCIKRLSSAGISTFVIMGNHDYKRFGGTYTSALSSMASNSYPNVRILLKPESISIANKRKERANLILFPFRDKRMYKGKTTKEKSLACEQEILEMINQSNKKYPTVFVGHNFFYQGSYNDFGGSEVLINPTTFNSCSASFMGHYHSFKKMSGPDNCFYTGSMEKNNFGEAHDDKYLLVYDTNTLQTEKVLLPNRNLHEIKIDLTKKDLTEIGTCLDASLTGLDLSGQIARAKISIDENMMSFITKKYIEERLYELSAHYVSAININPVYKKISRDLSPLKEDTDFDIFKKFLENESLHDKKLQDKILQKAKEIVR